MIVDSHQHVILPTAAQLQKMDAAGIDKAVLFTTTPHIERAASAALDAIDAEMQTLYRLLSGSYTPEERMKQMPGTVAELKQTIAQEPDRLTGFGPVPLGLSARETAQWIETYIVRNAFKGVGEFTPGSELQMQQLEAVFQALADYPGIPIWVHTFHPVTLPGLRILMGLCSKYPKTPVIFGHMGGSFWMEAIAFAKQNANAYMDLSAAFTPLSVKAALVEVPQRCLFSSDAPFGEPYLSRQMLEYVSPSPEATALALGENIAALVEL